MPSTITAESGTAVQRAPVMRWVFVIVVAAYTCLVVFPYVAVGPNDVEVLYRGVVGTKVAVDALLAGDWPFWSLNLGSAFPFRSSSISFSTR